MDIEKIYQQIVKISEPKYWKFVAENDGKCCDQCQQYAGKIFSEDDPAKPDLPLHPHCRCSFELASEKEKKLAYEIIEPSTYSKVFRIEHISEILSKLENIVEFKVPKPPRITNHKASWLHMTWMWFFEEGENPAHFSANSPESQDIVNSFSMKEIKEKYFQTGKIPEVWSFTGPGTATYQYGEVEWFMGSYTIKNFKIKDGIATFTIYNKSGWHSGTRLPKSWSDKIYELSSYRIEDLVSDAPRGKVFKTKFEKNIPFLLKIPGNQYILKKLPSFGGDWEQYYEIRMEWKK